MKKCLVVLSVIVFALAFVASDLMAYQEAFDSAGHRTQSRNAANGTIDAAYYNPAGLVAMKEGLYVDAGNRILSLTTKTKFVSTLGVTPAGHETESSTMTYLLPNLAVAYNTGKAVVFYSLDIRAGGAGGDWSGKDAAALAVLGKLPGSNNPANWADINGASVKGTTYTLGHTLGGAFALNNMVTMAAGLRYMRTTAESSKEFPMIPAAGGTIKIESESTLDGYAPFIGVQVAAMPGLNISLQFQGRAHLVGEESTDTTSLLGKTSVEAYDDSWMASVLYFGVGYTVMPGLEVMFSYTNEFTADQRYGGTVIFDKDDKDKQVFGLGAEYTVMPGLLVSGGFAYKLTGTDDTNNADPSDPSFDEIDLGFGAVYTVMPGLNVQVAFAYNIYSEMDYVQAGSKFASHNRDAWVIGLGVSYKAL